MVEKNEKIEQEVFKKLIQSDIEIFTYNDNFEKIILKCGKLINFNIKLPFLYFVIEYREKTREFPLPQPFKFDAKENELVFSYRLMDSVIEQKIVDKMQKIGKDSESKIYNRLVYIKPIT